MKVAQSVVTFRSGAIRFDPGARVLYASGSPAKLGSRAFDLLEALIERRDRLVPKQELMDVVWPGLVVEENNLQVHVVTLRKLLGAEAITTVSGRGYRLTLVPDGERRLERAGNEDQAPLTAVASLLFGRESLIAATCALLRRREVRLATLVGAGGSGKTRVALQVTAELTHDFADGSYIVMLAPVRDPAFIGSAIAAVLHLQEVGSRQADELVIAHLKSRETLLTLDNFEHLRDAVPLVGRLLESCPKLKILITSRAVLRLATEHDVVVPPLALPNRADNASKILNSPAVQLFLDRVRASGRPVPSSEETLVIGEVCRRLDGLPLALELAAARLKVLSPQALLDRLEHRLQILKSGPTDLPERQRTLRSAIGWSYGLLDPHHQRLFQRLSVFVGGWSLDAAEAVCSDNGETEAVLDGLEHLIDQSLVQRVDDVGGQSRFMMLETIREYALEQLEQGAEVIAARRRHASFFVEFAEKAEPHLTHGGRRFWLQQLQAEVNNFRSALGFLLEEHSDVESGMRLAAAMPWMWYFGGQYAEGRRWLSIALAKATAADPRLFAKALTGSARLAMYSGDPGQAIEQAQRSVELCRQTGDKRGLAFALFHLGLALAMKSGHGDPGRQFIKESEDAFAAVADAWGVALATSYFAVVSTFDPQQDERSKQLLLKGRALFTALDDDWGMSTSLHYLRTIAMRQGEYIQARQYSDDAMRIARELGDGYRVARNLHGLAEIAMAEAQNAEAISHLKASISMSREQGRVGDSALQLRLLARLELLEGRPDHTVRLLAASSTVAEHDRTMPPDVPALTEQALSQAHQQLGDRRFDHEWSMGLAMSWDQAVSWALAA
jgi:predicted ATPase/DNA-binding winged helix-turn-helix (wHTH) protein